MVQSRCINTGNASNKQLPGIHNQNWPDDAEEVDVGVIETEVDEDRTRAPIDPVVVVQDLQEDEGCEVVRTG